MGPNEYLAPFAFHRLAVDAPEAAFRLADAVIADPSMKGTLKLVFACYAKSAWYQNNYTPEMESDPDFIKYVETLFAMADEIDIHDEDDEDDLARIMFQLTAIPSGPIAMAVLEYSKFYALPFNTAVASAVNQHKALIGVLQANPTQKQLETVHKAVEIHPVYEVVDALIEVSLSALSLPLKMG
ncbi:MAG: hypothetical protein FWG30_07120 [Eubacteriaceae bacterium]|nr:hypothetical protein [Eubacteriaceae bacterium]